MEPFSTSFYKVPSAIDQAVSKHIQSVDISNCDTYGEDGAWVVDLEVVRGQLHRWKRNLSRVKPFYAVKCNPTPQLLDLLADPSHNIGFDCATHTEISQILSRSVSPSNIIYANPCKAPSHVRYASTVDVKKMTFDNATELIKIKSWFLNAECVLRFKVGDTSTNDEGAIEKPMYELSNKYGVTLEGSRGLLIQAKKLGLNVTGVAFHVGSGQRDHRAYAHHLKEARKIWEVAREVGYKFSLLDIGGGFMDENFEEAAATINKALDQDFGDLIQRQEIQIIAEPGRYICAPAFTLVTSVVAVREEDEEPSGKRMAYLADGIYSNINAAMWPGELTFPTVYRGKRMNTLERPKLEVVASSASSDSGIELEEGESGLSTPEEGIGMQLQGDLQEYSVWGPTCDCGDVVFKSEYFPKGIEVGDWFVFKGLGAYSTCMRNPFNGFATTHKFYILNE